MKLLAPFYIWPGHVAEWERILAVVGKGDFVIVNPSDGPGTAVDPLWSALITKLRKRKAGLLGYVSTVYGQRPLDSCALDVEKWKAFYGVLDIFLDEAVERPPNPPGAKLPFYKELCCKVRGRVVLNPGVPPHQDYLKIKGAIFVISETGYQRFMELELPAWVKKKGKRCAAMLEASPSWETTLPALEKMKAAGIRWCYATDKKSFDTLPPYFDQMIQWLRKND